MDPNVAVDAPKENRPGVPRVRVPPKADAPLFGPVSSKQHPPRGLSGALRRKAYRLPDYRVRRWLFLLLADRIEALSSKFRR